jgi:hypothetical protein
MFERMKLKAGLGEFTRRLRISNETHAILWEGINMHVPEMKRRKLDGHQGAVLLISSAIVNAGAKGGFKVLKAEHPQVFADLLKLWTFCGELIQADYDRFACVMKVPAHDGSPFKDVG